MIIIVHKQNYRAPKIIMFNQSAPISV